MASGRPSSRRHSCAIRCASSGAGCAAPAAVDPFHEQGNRDGVVAQRRNGHDDFAVELQVLTTRRQHTRPPAQQHLDLVGGGIDHVLAVVNDDQHVRRTDCQLDGGKPRSGDPERPCDRRDHAVRVVDGSPGRRTRSAPRVPCAASPLRSRLRSCRSRPARRASRADARREQRRCDASRSSLPSSDVRRSGSSTTVGPARSEGKCPGPICTMVCWRSSPFRRNAPSGRCSTSSEDAARRSPPSTGSARRGLRP